MSDWWRAKWVSFPPPPLGPHLGLTETTITSREVKERVWLHIRHQRPCPPGAASSAASSEATGPPPGPMIRLPRRWVRWCEPRFRSLAKYRCPYPNFRRRSLCGSSKSGRKKLNNHQLQSIMPSPRWRFYFFAEVSSPSCCFSLPHCQPAPALNLQWDLSTPSPSVSTLFHSCFISEFCLNFGNRFLWTRSKITYLQPGGRMPGGGWNPAVG